MEVGSHWTDFQKIWYFENLKKKLLRKFKFYYNRTRVTGTLHEDQYTFLITLIQFFLHEKFFSQKLERRSKHISCSINFSSRKSCRLWDNVEKYCTAGQATDDSIMRRMCIAHGITRATDTHSKLCNTYCWTLPNLTWYVHCLSSH